MTTIPDIRQELQQKLDDLPDSKLQEVLVFLNDLSMQTPEFQEGNINQSDGENDPLSEFIGAVFHGSLAKNIDQELYG